MSWLHRYDDIDRPTVRGAIGAIASRGILPMLGLLTVNLVIGFIITHPGDGWRWEDSVNKALQSGRTPLMDALTRGASAIGSAPGNIGGCIIFMAIVYWITRRWWVALLPGLALSLEAIVHAVTSTIVNRDRPAVEHLDAAQPTASFPSGHVGATLAQLLILILLTQHLPQRSKAIIAGVSLAFVAFLGFSRLYLGMHHGSDVTVGIVNGIVCAALAWNYLPRDSGGRQVRAKRALANEYSP